MFFPFSSFLFRMVLGHFYSIDNFIPLHYGLEIFLNNNLLSIEDSRLLCVQLGSPQISLKDFVNGKLFFLEVLKLS